MNHIFLKAITFSCISILSFSTNAEVPSTEIGATFMFDYSMQDGNSRDSLENDLEFNTEIRRARLSLKHTLNKDWLAKLQTNFNEDDESEIGDAYVRYQGFKGVKLTMGRFKEPFGLENMTSSKDIRFLERSMASNAFGPGRNKGFMLSLSPGDVSYAFSFTNLEAKDDDHAPYALTTRATWAPIANKYKTLHIGLSGSLRLLDGEEFEFDERAELRSMEKIIESGEIETEQLRLSALEAAYVDGAFSVQSEFMMADLQASDESRNVEVTGYYVEASYVLTGEKRGYKNGAFSSIDPKSKKGAWELTSRASVLDASDADDGIEVRSATIGLNYYANENVKLMSNLIHTRSSENSNGSDNGNGVGFRVQYSY